MSSDDEYDPVTKAYLARPAVRRPILLFGSALNALRALPTQVALVIHKSQSEITKDLHEWACVIHDMGRVEISSAPVDIHCHARGELDRNACDKALVEFATQLNITFFHTYNQETADNIVNRMGCIFDEGMRQLDEAWWQACFACEKRMSDDHMKEHGPGVMSQKYVCDKQQGAESIMFLKEDDVGTVVSLNEDQAAGAASLRKDKVKHVVSLAKDHAKGGVPQDHVAQSVASLGDEGANSAVSLNSEDDWDKWSLGTSSEAGSSDHEHRESGGSWRILDGNSGRHNRESSNAPSDPSRRGIMKASKPGSAGGKTD